MSQQIQITGGAKVRNLDGVITGSTGVLNSLPINGSNGIPQLDSNGKILVSQLPNSVMEYKGMWNVATNTPYLVNGTGNAGDVYLVTGAATGGTSHDFGSGPITFYNSDQVIYDGTNWDRASGSSGTVTSVGLTMPSAFSVSGSPVTNSGTLAVSALGTTSQYINGAGGLTTFPSLTGYVPYTGATSDVDLGTHKLTLTDEQFNPSSAPSYSEGEVWYDSTQKALAYYNDVINNTLHIGQEVQLKVYNNTGSTIVKGAPVYITSTNSGFTYPLVALAKADTLTTANVIGVANQDIPTSSAGYIVLSGLVSNISTGSYTVGTVLYLSPYSAGQLMSTVPPTGYAVRIGVVSYSNSPNGSIYINQSNAYSTAANIVGTIQISQGGTGATTAGGALTNLGAQAQLNGTGFVKASGTTISYDNSTYYLASNPSAYIPLTALSAGTGISYNNTTGVISSTITQYTDAMARASISLTTTGTSGAATYNSTTGVLNIPQYTGIVTSVFGRTGAVVATEGDYTLTLLGDVTITTPSSGQVLKYNGTGWVNGTETYVGTVTSVAMSVPTGLSVSGSPITSSGTLAVTFTTGYSIPTTASQSNWDTAYTNRITSLTTTGSSGSATLVSNVLNIPTYTLAGLGGISLTSLSASTPLSYNNTTGAFSIQVANTSQSGYLSSTDWNTFNSKQNALTNPVTGTGVSGQVTYFNGTSTVTGSANHFWDAANNRLGIGTNTPSYKLHVSDTSPVVAIESTATNNPYLRFVQAGTVQSSIFFHSPATSLRVVNNYGGLEFWANAVPAMYVNSNGTVSINNSNSTYYLDVTGNGNFSNTPTFSSSGNQALLSTQYLTVPSGGTFNNGGTWASTNNSNVVTWNGTTSVNNGATMAGFVAVNRHSFGGAGYTITANQSSGIRAIAGLQVLQQTGGSNNGTISHGASMFVQGIYPSGTANVTFTNYYGLLLNSLDEWGGVTLTNRWGIYQAGASDNNYFAGKVNIGSNTLAGYNLDVTGTGRFTGAITAGNNINFQYGGTTYFQQYVGSGGDLVIYNNTANGIYMYTNGVQRLLIASTGAATFSSSVTANSTISTSDGFYSSKTGSNSVASGAYLQLNNNGIIQANASNGLDFWTLNGSWYQRMTITQAGNVLIGTTTDDTIDKLQINGNIKAFNGNLIITSNTQSSKQGITSVPNQDSSSVNLSTIFPAFNFATGNDVSLNLQIIATSGASGNASSHIYNCVRTDTGTWTTLLVSSVGSANILTLTFTGTTSSPILTITGVGFMSVYYSILQR